MSESGVTVFSTGGIALESISEAVGVFSTIASIAVSVGVSTNQAYCLISDLSNRIPKAFSIRSSERAQAYSIYPALSAATGFTRSPVTDLLELVRHGIVVSTADPQNPGKSIYFYIGGVSSEWINERRIQNLFAAQAGSGFGLKTAIFNDQIKHALSSSYPIIVAPLKPIGSEQTFVNPPNAKCSSSWLSQALNYTQSSSLWWATFIPNYVGSILFHLSTYSPNFYGYNEKGYNWYLTQTVRQLIQAISGEPPLFYAGLAMLPQLEQFGLGTIDVSNFYTFDFTNSYPQFIGQSYLTYPFPLLNGAPAYTDMLCSGGDNCSGLSIAGFVVAPGGLSWYNAEIPNMVQAQLIPAPSDFSFNGIMNYASQLGQYTWVDQLVQKIRKAFRVISILVSSFGWLEQQAEKAVYALEWFGAEFEKTAEEIAQDIVNEFNSPPHTESQHSDQAGQEIHNAYMCARFGLYCY